MTKKLEKQLKEQFSKWGFHDVFFDLVKIQEQAATLVMTEIMSPNPVLNLKLDPETKKIVHAYLYLEGIGYMNWTKFVYLDDDACELPRSKHDEAYWIEGQNCKLTVGD